MTIQLYDLAGEDPALRFSPYCWRTRMALAHKGLPVETLPWRFTDKDVIAFSGQGLVPVLVDGGEVVSDSWRIATYLESAYPDRPSLFGPGGPTPVRFHNCWADAVVNVGVVPLVVSDIPALLHPKDHEYFVSSREKRLGTSLAQLGATREGKVAAFRQSLQPLRMVVREQPFLGGDAPNYADYAVFGGFQWARCVSAFPLLAEDDPVAAWRGRLLDAFDGLARRAPGSPV